MGTQERFFEIDIARGIAILMMVLFHTLFDLSYFSLAAVNVATGFWRYFAYATATLFLLVVGISLVVSHARAVEKLSGFLLAKKFLVRGAEIFALGLLVTLATWLYIPTGCILFGILHLIGVSVMLSPLFFRLKKYNLLAGLACIAIGLFVIPLINPITASLPDVAALLLLPLGLHSATFWSVDYTPVFPWIGVVLIGLGTGEFLYGNGVRHFTMPYLSDIVVRPLSLLGRHSLLIYLVHQPVIILLLAVVTGTKVL
ncbi:MAG: DUF1624 domain-containing protein [Methanoregula sp.]|nr:DUF1624 domain-containing protein [Methanoregula sp.]